MPVYWMFLGLSLLSWFAYANSFHVISFEGNREKRAWGMQAVLFFSVIILFCGLRSGIADTGAYIHMFEIYPSNISDIQWKTVDMDKGFYLFTVAYKQFISQSYHGWLFIFTLISGIALIVGFLKYAEDYGFSCYLFIATTVFVYLVNGMRQFVCVTIIFAISDWIYKGKRLQFILVVLFLSTFHASALIFIPLSFIITADAWSPRMLMIVGLSVAGIALWGRVLPSIGSALETTQYSEYVDLLADEAAGVNIFRLLIAAVPVGLAFAGRRIIRQEGTRFINLAVNMSVINFCLYMFGRISSGMTFGRVAIYFEIFNLILLPWLIRHLFTRRSGRFICVACVVLYLVFFYYQMVLTWRLDYISDILHLAL